MSDARKAYEVYKNGNPYIGAPPAPSSVSHPNYSVSYYNDNSVLICAKGRAVYVLDAPKTYYRQDIEHAARCLGTFGREGIAKIVREKYDNQSQVWIDNVLWSNEGELLDVS